MKKTINGYITLFHKYGLIKAIKFFISWYYGQFQLRGKDHTKENSVIVNGCNLNLIPNDMGISYELLKFKIHEPITTKILQMKLKPGMICFDVGGNIGYYATLESRLVGINGYVFVTEPSPKNRNYLQKNLSSLNIKNFNIFNFACGDNNGTTKFLISKFSNYSQIYDPNKIKSNENEIVNVPIKKLDTFVDEQNLENLNFIRMDIEGHELSVIEGAKKCILKFKPMIQIELHINKLGKSNAEKILKFLKDAGYSKTLFFNAYLDTPLVGTIRDVRTHSVTEIIDMLHKEKLPKLVMIFLENENNGE